MAASGGGIASDALSTITVRYVAARDDSGSVQPTRSPDDVEQAVRGRADISKLDSVLGGVAVNVRYVPDLEVWTAAVVDKRNRVVRTVNIPDRL